MKVAFESGATERVDVGTGTRWVAQVRLTFRLPLCVQEVEF